MVYSICPPVGKRFISTTQLQKSDHSLFIFLSPAFMSVCELLDKHMHVYYNQDISLSIYWKGRNLRHEMHV